jgi:tRNA(Arg) A34 adenosine deaminase TadA
MNAQDIALLERCIALAEEALDAGDEPFGSVLADKDGRIVAGGDRTRHPEFELARWAAENMTPEERAGATVYTSGEHCPMCAAAHAWVGLGRIVYASSTVQLSEWLAELGVPPAPVRSLPIQEIAPGIVVEGPAPELSERVHRLHQRLHAKKS